MKSFILIVVAALAVGYVLWLKPIHNDVAPLAVGTENTLIPLPIAPTHSPVQALQHKIKQTELTQTGLSANIQSDVKSLSSRDNRDAQAVEIKPGVFLTDISTIHQSVTVATINDDGRVQITEY